MDILILVALAFAGGLIVGWNFLPQPAWVRKLLGLKPVS